MIATFGAMISKLSTLCEDQIMITGERVGDRFFRIEEMAALYTLSSNTTVDIWPGALEAVEKSS